MLASELQINFLPLPKIRDNDIKGGIILLMLLVCFVSSVSIESIGLKRLFIFLVYIGSVNEHSASAHIYRLRY